VTLSYEEEILIERHDHVFHGWGSVNATRRSTGKEKGSAGVSVTSGDQDLY